MFPQKCLPSVWTEVESLRPLSPRNRWTHQWRGRQQQFYWVNDIDYGYDNDKKHIPVHVVICEEQWQEVDAESAEIVDKNARHVWISSRPLRWDCLHERCNLGARHRWGIEISLLVEKRQGYHYEHAFSYQWTAMKGFHLLMRLAHLLNAIVQYTRRVAKQISTLGVNAFLSFVKETCAHPWLSSQWIQQLLATPVQLRLI
ncbi:MAG: hypothetical protein GY927_11510 [bacterium]|nr:hypothetical protein [bacterium]